MEWYVLIHDFNKDKIETWNIFNNWKFKEDVYKLLDNFITFDKFLKDLEKEIKYYFWSKVEYEIEIAGIFSKNDKTEKGDVSMQLIPNIKPLALYIIEQYNKEKELTETI